MISSEESFNILCYFNFFSHPVTFPNNKVPVEMFTEIISFKFKSQGKIIECLGDWIGRLESATCHFIVLGYRFKTIWTSYWVFNRQLPILLVYITICIDNIHLDLKPSWEFDMEVQREQESHKFLALNFALNITNPNRYACPMCAGFGLWDGKQL